MKKLLLICIVWLCFCNGVQAQDPRFNMPLLNPIYLNPALVGSYGYYFDDQPDVSYQDVLEEFQVQGQSLDIYRIFASHRSQRVGFDEPLLTTSFSADYFHSSTGLGFGLVAFRDALGGESRLRRHEASLVASYTLYPSDKPNIIVKGGFQLGAGRVNINDPGRLRFGDMLNAQGMVVNPTTDPLFGRVDGASYFNLSMGGQIMLNQQFWVGASLHNINRPDLSLVGGNSEDELGRRLTLYGGFTVSPKWFYLGNMTTQLVYQQQAGFNTLFVSERWHVTENFFFGAGYLISLKEINTGNTGNLSQRETMLSFNVGVNYNGNSFAFNWDTGIGSNLEPNNAQSIEFTVIMTNILKRRIWCKFNAVWMRDGDNKNKTPISRRNKKRIRKNLKEQE